MSASNYVTRVLSAPRRGPTQKPGTRCSRLEADPSPFMRHEYLAALHTTGAAVAETGWQAQFVTLWERRRTGGRVPDVPQAALLRRVRVRLGLGQRL